MITLSELERSTLCVLDHQRLRVECMVVNPEKGRVVHLGLEEIVYYSPESRITAIGEPMGSIIIWRAIDD